MSDIPVFLTPILEDLSSSRSSSNRRRRALTKLDGLLATLCLPKLDESLHETEERDRIKQVFVELQDEVDGNVASILIPLASKLLPQFHSQVVNSAKPAEFEPIMSELVGIFQVVQGICLLHRPSKNLVGGRRSTMEMILDLLLLTRHIPLFPTSLSGSAQPDLPLSSLLASTLLDTLFTALVDSSRNIRMFEQAGGLECLMRMLKGKTVPKDIRMKSLEFLFFYLLPEGQVGARGQMVGASGVDQPIELRGGIDLEDLPILLASPRQPRPSSGRLANTINTANEEDKFSMEGNIPSTPDSSRMYHVETPSTQNRSRDDKRTPRPPSESHSRRPSTPGLFGSPSSQHAYFHQTPSSAVKSTSQRSASPSPRQTSRPTDLEPPALITTAPTSSSKSSVSSKQTTTLNLASHGLGISTPISSSRRAHAPDTYITSKSTKASTGRATRSGSNSTTSSSSTFATRSDREDNFRKTSSSTSDKTQGRLASYSRSISPIKTSSDKASHHPAHDSQISDPSPLTGQSSLGTSTVNTAPTSSTIPNVLTSPLTSPNSSSGALATSPATSLSLSSTCMADPLTAPSVQPTAEHRPIIQIQSPSRTSSGNETPSRSKRLVKDADDRTSFASKLNLAKSPVRSTPQSHKLSKVLLSTHNGGLQEKDDLFGSPQSINSHAKPDPEENKNGRERKHSFGLMLPPKDIPAHRKAASASLSNAPGLTSTPSLVGSQQPQSSTRRSQFSTETSSHKASASRSSINLHSIVPPSMNQPQLAKESLSVHPIFLPPSQALPPAMLPLPSPTMSTSTVSTSIASDGSLSPYMTPSTSPYLLSAPSLSPDPSVPPPPSSSFSSFSRSPSKSPRIRQSRPPTPARSPRAPLSDAKWGDTNGQGSVVDMRGDGVRTVQEKKALLSVYLGDLDRLMGALGTPAK